MRCNWVGLKSALNAALFGILLFLSGCAGGPPPTETKTNPEREAGLLRANDRLKIYLKETPQGDIPHEVVIREDGMITLPKIGDVKAAGKTISELQTDIYKKYYPDYYLKLTVSIEPTERYFFVGGEVKNESQRPYLGQMTVTKAIRSAGGFTDFAKKKSVRLTRANGETFIVNCEKAIKNAKYDLPVYPGDQIVVPRRL